MLLDLGKDRVALLSRRCKPNLPSQLFNRLDYLVSFIKEYASLCLQRRSSSTGGILPFIQIYRPASGTISLRIVRRQTIALEKIVELAERQRIALIDFEIGEIVVPNMLGGMALADEDNLSLDVGTSVRKDTTG